MHAQHRKSYDKADMSKAVLNSWQSEADGHYPDSILTKETLRRKCPKLSSVILHCTKIYDSETPDGTVATQSPEVTTADDGGSFVSELSHGSVGTRLDERAPTAERQRSLSSPTGSIITCSCTNTIGSRTQSIRNKEQYRNNLHTFLKQTESNLHSGFDQCWHVSENVSSSENNHATTRDPRNNIHQTDSRISREFPFTFGSTTRKLHTGDTAMFLSLRLVIAALLLAWTTVGAQANRGIGYNDGECTSLSPLIFT